MKIFMTPRPLRPHPEVESFAVGTYAIYISRLETATWVDAQPPPPAGQRGDGRGG